jgi:hypothetical protein
MNLTDVTIQLFEIQVPVSFSKLLYRGRYSLLCHSSNYCPAVSPFRDVQGLLLLPFYLLPSNINYGSQQKLLKNFCVHILHSQDTDVVFHWVALLVHIFEAPGLNLRHEAGYSDRHFSRLLAVPSGEHRCIAAKHVTSAFFPIFLVIPLLEGM